MAILGKQTGVVHRDQECKVVVRYQLSEPQEWPWSLTFEQDQPVLTITAMDDSSLGIALRAIAQAKVGESAIGEQNPTPRAGERQEFFPATRN